MKILIAIFLVFVLSPLAPMRGAMGQTSETNQVQLEKMAEFLEGVKEEMEDKGWGEIELVAGEADSGRWGGLVLEPAQIGENCLLYTMIGQTDGMYDNPISAVVRIVFNRESLEWEQQEAFYVSEAGRYFGKDDFDFQLEADEILAHDNESLWDNMYSY